MLAGHFEIKHFQDKSLGFGLKILHLQPRFTISLSYLIQRLLVSNWKVYEVCWFTVYTAPSTIVVFWKVWPLHDFHWAWEGELGHGLFRSVTLWLLPFCLEIPPEWLIIETRSCHESVKEVIQDHCVMTCYPCCPRSFPLTWDETSIVDYWDRAL